MDGTKGVDEAGVADAGPGDDGVHDAALRLDDQLCFALYAATNTVVRRYRPLLSGLGLTYPQYLLMLVLWQDGARPVHEIAARLALPANGLTPLVDRLEAAGLVERRQQARDRRVLHVHLTPAGVRLEAEAARVQREVACSTRLSSAELDGLRAQLHNLLRQMDSPTDLRAGVGARTSHVPTEGAS